MMTRRTLFGFAAAAGGVIGLVGCSASPANYNYRLRLDIETPDGPRHGESVLQCMPFDTGDHWWSRGELRRAGVRVKGEAVAVDLGARGTLFALLIGPQGDVDYAAYLPQKALIRLGVVRTDYSTNPNISTTEIVRNREQAIRSHRGVVDLLPAEIPMLVRFGDLADPKSVASVDPNDLAASFGPGVKLVRATIETTDDPVTTGIAKRLGWLEQYYDQRLDGSRFGSIESKNRFANSLSAGASRAGETNDVRSVSRNPRYGFLQ